MIIIAWVSVVREVLRPPTKSCTSPHKNLLSTSYLSTPGDNLREPRAKSITVTKRTQDRSAEVVLNSTIYCMILGSACFCSYRSSTFYCAGKACMGSRLCFIACKVRRGYSIHVIPTVALISPAYCAVGR